MTPTTTPPPIRFDPYRFDGRAMFRPFTGDEYDDLVRTGFFSEEDPLELLERCVVFKMPADPAHDGAVLRTFRRLDRLAPPGWTVRSQVGAKLTESRPEPDAALARGDERTYDARQPTPADLGLVVEVSNTSLAHDRGNKGRVYARDRIPGYWVVNLIDRQVEVYTDPSGPTDPVDPRYATRRDFPAGSAVPVELDGVTVGTIPVDDLLP